MCSHVWGIYSIGWRLAVSTLPRVLFATAVTLLTAYFLDRFKGRI